MSEHKMARVAVVGAGPAGLYATEALLHQSERRTSVDLFDRLPTPYGLVRHGVAPDHPTIKSVVSTLDTILTNPGLRFIGGVDIGTAVTRDDLLANYDAVLYSTGAAADNELAISGEKLAGSLSATELVSWYNGHPDAVPVQLDAKAVAVIGAGNVALDIARLLASPYERLASTDIPPAVLQVFATSPVRDVHVICRRGPADVKFSSKELREIGQIDGIDIDVDLQALARAHDDSSDRRVTNNLALFRAWAERGGPTGRSRRVHFRFFERPVEIIGNGRVEAIRLQRSDIHPVSVVLPIQMVVRSVGQRSVPIPGLPFDPVRGVVPNILGRVTDVNGRVQPREYVSGWVKRGASGVIGTNKLCARESVEALLSDWRGGAAQTGPRRGIDATLQERHLAASGLAGWRAIDREEVRRGQAEDRARSKIADWPTLTELARAATDSPTNTVTEQELS
jgi:ferredoxin--NADP+ reductase